MLESRQSLILSVFTVKQGAFCRRYCFVSTCRSMNWISEICKNIDTSCAQVLAHNFISSHS